jgi:hypothetical protein
VSACEIVTTMDGRHLLGILERLVGRGVRRLLTWGQDGDGRLVLLFAIGAYLSTIALGRLQSGIDLWPLFGVPSGPSLFFDARNLTAAWECDRLGYDPLYENPCDPWARPLMYPRLWLLVGAFGLGQSHTTALSVGLVAAMFLSFGLLVGRVPAGTGVVLALAACSPPIMLAVERANMDVALFSLIAMSTIVWGAFPGPARVVSPLIVLVAAMAKIYPVFALPTFVMTRNRVASRVALLCLAQFAVYSVYSFRDLAQVATIATQGEHFSYGVRILPAHLYHSVGADHWAGPAALKQLLACVPFGVIAVAIAFRVRRRRVSPRCETTVGTVSLVAFHAGALIYLGTFAIANNFDYRLVFLLLTLPQLVEWARMPAHPMSSLASATLVGILVLLWVGSLSQWLNLWDELASWIVAGLLAAALAATVPRSESVRKSAPGGVRVGTT